MSNIITEFSMLNIKMIYWYCSGLPVLCKGWIKPLQNVCLYEDGQVSQLLPLWIFSTHLLALFQNTKRTSYEEYHSTAVTCYLASQMALPQGISQFTWVVHIISDHKWTGPTQTRSCVTFSRWPCFGKEVGLAEVQRSSNPNDSVILRLWASKLKYSAKRPDQ